MTPEADVPDAVGGNLSRTTCCRSGSMAQGHWSAL